MAVVDVCLLLGIYVPADFVFAHRLMVLGVVRVIWSICSWPASYIF